MNESHASHMTLLTVREHTTLLKHHASVFASEAETHQEERHVRTVLTHSVRLCPYAGQFNTACTLILQ